ncbi:aldehyde:ferredoxin oxidoreductase [Aminivibrio pyruvatiphilus]|uniref:Aldehyde:ferredoxin oxidoreductase n=1 Tax=Aminivibrio pyruvatiphilus TaxID=1005740 RepID=A0A4R8LYW8_9BACT|nr:aldehyde ferredoxin oxidoreductase C-terminal domain-containing protein [Aminivibrio pyruvatiphilus]TDY53584.1 aldehyde:ferredoxin oxidoreductase [Aminivibrio pyruvatiphilus]
MPEVKTGRVARVDLTERRVEIRETPDFYGNLGGRGFGVFELLRGVVPGTDPLSAENLLVFAAGSLTGTSFPGSSRIALVTKNVLSGGISTSSGGGNLGPKFRQAGFDALVISGRASSPCWILLKDGQVEIRDGSELWGLSVSETADAVRTVTGDSGAETASIGIAGERLAAVSCVMIDRAHALAWGGSGAVMGYKNLKAVAASGREIPKAADGDAFLAESRRYSWVLRASSASAALRAGGTHGMAGVGGWSGKVPTSVRNLQEEFWDGEKSARISEAAFRPMERKRTACWNCPLSCLHLYETERDGKRIEVEGMHANSVRGLGSNLDLDDPAALLEAHRLCNESGLDVDGVAAALGWAIECFERGLLGPADTDGLELRWGNGEAILALIGMIAERKGFGRLLGEGVLEAAKTVGRGSEQFAMHVKGVGLNEQGVRSHKAWGFGMAVSARGGGHLNGSPQTENRQISSWTGQWLFGNDNAGVPGSYGGKGRLVAWYEIYKAIVDSVGMCYFTSGWYDPALADIEPLSRALEAFGCGGLTPEEIWRRGRRIVEAEKAFNTVHAGFGRKDDMLPARVMEEPLTFGPYAGAVMDRPSFEKMLDEFYRERGWDPETGLQTTEGLMNIGAPDIAEYLRKGRWPETS